MRRVGFFFCLVLERSDTADLGTRANRANASPKSIGRCIGPLRVLRFISRIVPNHTTIGWYFTKPDPPIRTDWTTSAKRSFGWDSTVYLYGSRSETKKSPPKRAFAESNRPTDDAALVLLQIVQDLAEQAWRVRGPLWDLKRLPSQSPIGHLGYCKQKCCRRPPPIAPPQE